MKLHIGEKTIELVEGDVTLQEVDAIVNAANSRLAGGGGVDGAIHRCGGPAIMRETDEKYPQGCPTGTAVISTAGKLPARYVIHTVGPVWSGGARGEEELLKAAYRSSLELAVANGCRSVAFPSLSTGAYRYPLDRAARAAVSTAVQWLGERELPQLVRFVLFDAGAYGAFAAALEEIQRGGTEERRKE